MLRTLLAALLVVALSTLSLPVFAQETSSAAVYTEDKINIVAAANQSTFIIKLKSNPTTGYSWFLREHDPDLITPVKHSFLSVADKALMGAPGYEMWTFKLKPAAFIVPQQTVMRFIYARPWQGPESATQLMFRISTVAKT